MVQLNREGVEEHFSICIALDIINSLVKLVDDGFLLFKAAKLVEPRSKVIRCLPGYTYGTKVAKFDSGFH